MQDSLSQNGKKKKRKKKIQSKTKHTRHFQIFQSFGKILTHESFITVTQNICLVYFCAIILVYLKMLIIG